MLSPMKGLLLLLRHGLAGASPDGSDLARPLSPVGREQARQLGVALKPRVRGELRAWTSPARRCRETAELVTRGFATASVEVRDELVMDGDAEALALAVLGVPRPALLVGHQPDLSALVARLLGETVPAPSFRPGTCVALAAPDTEGSPWALAFELHADDLLAGLPGASR